MMVRFLDYRIGAPVFFPRKPFVACTVIWSCSRSYNINPPFDMVRTPRTRRNSDLSFTEKSPDEVRVSPISLTDERLNKRRSIRSCGEDRSDMVMLGLGSWSFDVTLRFL